MKMRSLIDIVGAGTPAHVAGDTSTTYVALSTFREDAMDASPITSPPTSFNDLDRVEVVEPTAFENLDGQTVVMPAGSQGTIVGIWQQGRAYEVEFVKPFAALGAFEHARLRKI